MVLIRPILLLLMMSMVLSGGQALAYQYGYSSPYPYNAARAYYPAYAPATHPYYRQPARPRYIQARMPVQASTINTTPASSNAAPVVDQQSVAHEKNAIPDSGLSAKKQAFITTLLPYIEEENRRLAVLRRQVAILLDKLDSNAVLSADEQKQLSRLANEYRIDGDPLTQHKARTELMRKIDIIPASLALAQAANESAWGESRFAREANNLFGIWTYDESKGLKPLRREEGKKHLVRIFDDFGDSVRYYMHTLNSHPAYVELRRIRQQLRDANRGVDGHQMAAGLEKYSAKGKAYIELIQGLIEQNARALPVTRDQRA